MVFRFFLVNIGAKNVKKSEDTTKSQQSFYFPSRVVVNEELLLYPLLSMISEVGGYVGLLLGVSILQGVLYIVEYLNRKIAFYESEDSKLTKKRKNIDLQLDKS